MRRWRAFLTVATMMGLMGGTAPGQTPYKLPPPEITAILDAPPPPRVVLSPRRDAILLVQSRMYPSIEELAEPILRLGGVRINPRLGAAQRLISATGLSIQALDGSPA